MGISRKISSFIFFQDQFQRKVIDMDLVQDLDLYEKVGNHEDTVRRVISLSVEIAREGIEGKPTGTMFLNKIPQIFSSQKLTFGNIICKAFKSVIRYPL